MSDGLVARHERGAVTSRVNRVGDSVGVETIGCRVRFKRLLGRDGFRALETMRTACDFR